MTTYQKEQRWEMRYIAVNKDGEKTEKVCYLRSEEQKRKNIERAKELGYKIVSCKKLYPFNTYKNQHNFDLIHNIAMIELYDIWNGDKKVSDEEYDRLYEMKEKSEKFFSLPLPIAWIPWEDWKEAKEMATEAIIHRQEACIANGRYDLVALCAE